MQLYLQLHQFRRNPTCAGQQNKYMPCVIPLWQLQCILPQKHLPRGTPTPVCLGMKARNIDLAPLIPEIHCT